MDCLVTVYFNSGATRHHKEKDPDIRRWIQVQNPESDSWVSSLFTARVNPAINEQNSYLWDEVRYYCRGM
ncbi:MAG TPA: hypothetical protein VIL61_01590 [Nitrospiria bacterium]